MNTGLISFTEAAAYLGCAPRTLHKLIARSRLRLKGVPVQGPTIQFFQAVPRGPIQFRQVWLDRYIAAGTHHPDDAPMLTKTLPPKAVSEFARPHGGTNSGFSPAFLNL